MPGAIALLSAVFALIPPSAPLDPPRGDARPDDIVALASHPGPLPTADCGAAAWSHHPLDPTRPGHHCAAWLSLPDRAPVLIVGAVGEPPAALLPIVYRSTVGPGGRISTTATGPDPDLLHAITDALGRWTAP